MARETKWLRKLRDGEVQVFRLGPTADLEVLGRKAEYLVAVFAGLCGVSESTLLRAMDSDYRQTPSAWLGRSKLSQPFFHDSLHH